MATTKTTEKSAPEPMAESGMVSVESAYERLRELARAEFERYRMVAGKRQECEAANQAGNFQQAALLREEVLFLENLETGRDERRKYIRVWMELKAQRDEAEAAELIAKVAERRVRADEILAAYRDAEGVDLRPRDSYAITTTDVMERTANDLVARAKALRNEPIREDGRVTVPAGTPDKVFEGLVMAVLDKPEIIGPAISQIRAWVDQRRNEVVPARGQQVRMAWYRTGIAELSNTGLNARMG